MRTLMFISLLLPLCNSTTAQQGVSFCPIPLYQPIEVHILGCDENVLQCYNLYGYHYIDGRDTFYGEFIVPVKDDTFKHKTVVAVKLGKVKEFAVSSPGGCRKIPVDEGIQLKYPGQQELVYLNFDPAIPDPVFMPCK